MRVAIALIALCVWVVPGGAASWPTVVPVSRTFTFADGAHASASLDISGPDATKLYRIRCATFRVDDPEFDWSGDFECRLVPLYEPVTHSTYFTDIAHPTSDWQSRARFLVPEIVGDCGSHPEYGRIRNFRLRGMSIRLAMSDVRTAPSLDTASAGGYALTSFRFRIDVRPEATASSDIAEPVHVPVPPPLCGNGYRSPAPQQPWCAGSGRPSWSEQVRDVLAQCETEIVAPDGETRAHVSAAGELRVNRRDGGIVHADGIAIEPPAMLSWSPDSGRFFVNDGQGSGMTSVLRMFSLSSSSLTESARFQRQASATFRRVSKCGADALDPDVWGFGWSADGRQVYVLVTPTVHQPCGTDPLVLLMDSTTAGVAGTMSQEAARRRFGNIVPPGHAR